MRAQGDYALTLWLAKRPCFCCGCWCLSREDTQRTKRVLRLVRAVLKDWEVTRRLKAEDERQA